MILIIFLFLVFCVGYLIWLVKRNGDKLNFNNTMLVNKALTEKEKRKIDLGSIEFVYNETNKDFKEKIEKGYKDDNRFTAIEKFATDLDGFCWCTNEYIKRAELIHANYNRKELLDTMEAYTNEFMLFYEGEAKKMGSKKLDKVVKKIKNFEYVGKFI